MDLAPSLQVKLNMRLQQVANSDTPVNFPQLYRVLHDRELPGGVRPIVLEKGKALPEVFPLFPNQFTKLTRAWQWLWRDLNPQMSAEQWRKLLYTNRAFTNGQGYGEPDDPRADYINNLDTSSPLPKIECLVCGGALLAGIETTYKGIPSLMVDTLDGRAGMTVPTAEWVLARPWYYYQAISVSPDGSTQSFSLTPYPEYVPLVANIFPVYFPLAGLEKLDMSKPLPGAL